jgi:chromosomal replication initiation ATPase DnaA
MNYYTIPGIKTVYSPDTLVAVVCQKYGISINQFWDNLNKRKQPYCEMRQVLIFLLMHHLDWSERIAAGFVNRDHATANHAKKTVVNFFQTDKIFRHRTETLIGNLINVK